MKTLLLVPMGMAALLSIGPAGGGSRHEWTVAGALRAELTGNARFGPVHGRASACGGNDCPASLFSLELGSYSEKGAVVFSRAGGERPKVGTYRVSPRVPGSDGAEFHAVVSLGSLERPIGVFSAVSGTVTITQSSDRRVVGRYELRAVGFLAEDPGIENREILVRGGFSADPAAPPSTFSAVIEGAARTAAYGAADFGEIGVGRERTFTLTMGGYSEQAAIVLSRTTPGRPGVGVYPVQETGEGRGEFHGLVIPGSPSRPAGVFRVRRGTLTITTSTPERISGTLELDAVGFLSEDVAREERTVTVSGSFSATANHTPSSFSPSSEWRTP